MIIIDEQATAKLIHVLKTLAAPDGKYAICFCRIARGAGELRQRFFSQMEHYFPESEIYCCEDGDVVLLAREASLKGCRKAMYEAAVLFGIEPAENIGALYDLGVEIGSLLILLEEKSESRRKNEEAAAVRRVQEEALARAANRRQEILTLPGTVGDVNARRRGRPTPELMIIEDDAFSRRLVENVLAQDHRLTALASAEDALLTYASLAPDLLFLDINLPDVTGHELLEKIMALDPEAYIVMLSGNADKENVMQAMRLGARGFIAKPFTREKLFQYIERCTAIRKETA